MHFTSPYMCARIHTRLSGHRTPPSLQYLAQIQYSRASTPRHSTNAHIHRFCIAWILTGWQKLYGHRRRRLRRRRPPAREQKKRKMENESVNHQEQFLINKNGYVSERACVCWRKHREYFQLLMSWQDCIADRILTHTHLDSVCITIAEYDNNNNNHARPYNIRNHFLPRSNAASLYIPTYVCTSTSNFHQNTHLPFLLTIRSSKCSVFHSVCTYQRIYIYPVFFPLTKIYNILEFRMTQKYRRQQPQPQPQRNNSRANNNK